MGINDSTFGQTIYLDANVFIYLLEGYPEFSILLGTLFDLIDAKKIQAITSELILAETLVKPMADKNLALQKIYESTLRTSSGLQVPTYNAKNSDDGSPIARRKINTFQCNSIAGCYPHRNGMSA